jgi:pimeloyl-ACP methyl ester carboxylesterase
LGGQIALDFCLKYPDRVTKLILAGSAGLYERHLSDGSLPKPNKEFIREQAERVFFDKRHISEELIEQIYQQLQDRRYVRFLIRVAKVTRDYRMDDELAKVRVPTLLVWGAQDEVTPQVWRISFMSICPTPSWYSLMSVATRRPSSIPKDSARSCGSSWPSPHRWLRAVVSNVRTR